MDTMVYDWDPAKNDEIHNDHGITFPQIVELISRGGLIGTAPNPSPKYPGQKLLLVRRGETVYVVPFEIKGNTRWLITAFYSEKFTKKYSRKK